MPRKGYKQTPEHIAKIAAARTGKPTGRAQGWIHQGRRFVMVNGREVLEHRHIMEQHIGRPLASNEVVHHINGNPLDNRLENLQLMTRSEHNTLHNTAKSRKGNKMPRWTPEKRECYMEAFSKRPPLSREARQKISDTMKQVRAERFWSSCKK